MKDTNTSYLVDISFAGVTNMNASHVNMNTAFISMKSGGGIRSRSTVSRILHINRIVSIMISVLSLSPVLL